jgi:hypothetical protein
MRLARNEDGASRDGVEINVPVMLLHRSTAIWLN